MTVKERNAGGSGTLGCSGTARRGRSSKDAEIVVIHGEEQDLQQGRNTRQGSGSWTAGFGRVLAWVSNTRLNNGNDGMHARNTFVC